jgi:hypothetical protein
VSQKKKKKKKEKRNEAKTKNCFSDNSFVLHSNYKLKVVKEKAFLISQVLDETKIETSSSGLGLDGSRKLIKEVKKVREEGDSGE